MFNYKTMIDNKNGVSFYDSTDLPGNIGDYKYLCTVSIPNDAGHISENRVNKLYIYDCVEIQKSPLWKDAGFFTRAVSIDPSLMRYVDKKILFKHDSMKKFKRSQTHTICMDAVKYDGFLVLNVSKDILSDSIKFAAIKQNPMSIKYINKQTPEMGYEAIKNNWKVIKYIKQPEICLPNVKKEYEDLINLIYDEAVENDWRALKIVPSSRQTTKMCINALDQNKKALYYILLSKTEKNLILKDFQQKI
jgi:hypothetical protein